MKKLIFLTLIIILIPILIIGFNNGTEIINRIKYGSYSNKIIKVKRTSSQTIDDIPIETYVIGVVAGEMPVSFNIEALKAQAVTSRTYALKKAQFSVSNYDVTDNTSNQVYIDIDKMKEKWKDNYEINYAKVKEAVLKTKGEVLLYNNSLIDAMFFSTSNGYTENSEDVFSSNKPYLKSVSSSWDKTESPVFNTKKEMTIKEFLFALGIYNTTNIDISNIEKTATGRVKTITINKKIFSSNDIRSIFGLKSTSFNINVTDDKVSFDVYGFGHGVGMSQYGANGMAKEGNDYKTILLYYYKNCEIKKID